MLKCSCLRGSAVDAVVPLIIIANIHTRYHQINVALLMISGDKLAVVNLCGLWWWINAFCQNSNKIRSKLSPDMHSIGVAPTARKDSVHKRSSNGLWLLHIPSDCSCSQWVRGSQSDHGIFSYIEDAHLFLDVTWSWEGVRTLKQKGVILCCAIWVNISTN